MITSKIITLLILSFLLGCSVPPSQEPSTSSIVTMLATPTFLNIPITATLDSNITITPDLSNILPTFSPEDAKAFLEKELENNGNCRLPCAVGMTPGETVYKSVNDYLGQYSQGTTPELIDINTDIRTDFSMLNVSIFEKETRIVLIWGFSKSKNLLNQVYFSAEAAHEEGTPPDISSNASFGNPLFQQLLKNYSLHQVLMTYGKPDFVFIAPEPDDSGFIGNFDLALVYLKQGFFVEFIFPKMESGNNFSGCPIESAYINIVSWSQENENSQNNEIPFYGSRLPFNYFKSLDQATALSIDEFYQKFQSSSAPLCLETPKKIWEP